MGKRLRLGGGAVSTGGGIMGSGIHGMFGTTVVCNATDTSDYCTLTKFLTEMFMWLTIAFFVFLAIYATYYIFLKPMMKSKRG